MVDKRVNYFNGQLLQVDDFQDEQAYHVKRERLPFKALTSPGICGGLEVAISTNTQVTVAVGMAIDSEGRQIVLDEQTVDIPAEAQAGWNVYVTYLEQETERAEQGSLEFRRVSELPSISIAASPPETFSVQLATLTQNGGGGNWSVNYDAREYAGWRLPSSSDGGGILKYQSEDAKAELDSALKVKGSLQVVEGAVRTIGNLTVEGAMTAGSLALSGDLQVAGNKPIEFKTFPLTINSTYFTVDFATDYSADDWHCTIAGCQPNNGFLVGLSNSSINISTYANVDDNKWHVVGGGRLDPSLVGAWSVNVMAIIKPNLVSESDDDGSYESEDPVTTFPFTIPLGDSITLDLLHIPGDTFLMGSPEEEAPDSLDERPQHLVNVPTFLMGKYPVTREQWEWLVAYYDTGSNDMVNSMKDVTTLYSEQLGTNDSTSKSLPVTKADWWDANHFCSLLTRYSREQGLTLTFRLPTEAEWEYACRAGTTTQYYYGDTINDNETNVNCNGSSLGAISVVGSVGTPNHFGLYDMHGNVWEWCHDDYEEDYYADPQASIGSIACESPLTPEGETSNYLKVVRGGSWEARTSDCRSAKRHSTNRNDNLDEVGFRVVCSASWL